MDATQARLFDLEGIVNFVEARPAAGVGEEGAIRDLFDRPGVSSVQAVGTTARQFRDALDEFFGILRVLELIVLALTLLIAFNSSSISIDERMREHATMLAFGLRTRTLMTMSVIESAVIGLVGTVLGVALGRVVVGWMMTVQLEDTMPDLRVIPFVSTTTLLTAFLFGVVAVAVAPLFTIRRVRHMDIPATLRVME
jgi:putative ABC transport system permease protein